MAFTKLAGVAEPWGTRTNTAQWSFKDQFSPEKIEGLWEHIKSNPHWWETLPPMVSEEVFEAICKLQYHHQVLFVTARVSYHNAQMQTKVWLDRHGIYNASVIVSHKKGEIAAATGAAFHIDDKPENAVAVHWMADRTPCKSFYLEHPASRVYPLPERVIKITSVSEYLQAIEESENDLRGPSETIG